MPPADPASTSATRGSRLATLLIGVVFVLPVAIFIHRHFDLPLRVEVFLGGAVLLVAAFQLQLEHDARASRQRKAK